MQTYSTDLSEAEFGHIEEHLPAANQRGRPRLHGPRDILNAVFYVLKSGRPWRSMAVAAPRLPALEDRLPLVASLAIDGTWERLNAALRERLRVQLGRNPQAGAAMVDSQTTRTTRVGGNEHGFDPAKKVEGRQRHLLVDSKGLEAIS